MRNYNLGFISDENIYAHVQDTVRLYRRSIDLSEFNANIADPIKLTFDAKVYRKTIEQVISEECFRQIDKSNTNRIGYFHQQLFNYAGAEWIVPKAGFVVPMVFFSILGGAASLGQSLSIGKIGVVTFLYYTATSLISVTIALVAGALFCPGAGLDVSHIEFASLSAEEVEKAQSLPGFWDILISFIPANPFQALAEGQILQVIVFCLFAGFAMAHLPQGDRDFMMRIVDNGTQICVKIMMAVMMISPVGVFCLMADATGSFGYEVLLKLVYLIGLYILVIAIITYGMIGGSVALFSPHVSYRKFFSAMGKVQLFAFSTSSSMATLPLNMEVAEKELHISKAITSFALPLGATINMNGTAAYNALAAVFLAQLCGMELTMAQYVALLVSSTVGAIGQAGVPGPTFLMVAILLSAGIPIETLPILFGVDRIFDMLRTPVNITGDTACAAIVERYGRNG